VAAVTQESATSKAVYFAHCTSEMIFITHLIAENPERLAGPLLADTYVTLLKGRNAWYDLSWLRYRLMVRVKSIWAVFRR
jgi:glycerol-3-phosphate dehydrogenase (NAD+)